VYTFSCVRLNVQEELVLGNELVYREFSCYARYMQGSASMMCTPSYLQEQGGQPRQVRVVSVTRWNLLARYCKVETKKRIRQEPLLHSTVVHTSRNRQNCTTQLRVVAGTNLQQDTGDALSLPAGSRTLVAVCVPSSLTCFVLCLSRCVAVLPRSCEIFCSSCHEATEIMRANIAAV
jgi:hypothetical protein